MIAKICDACGKVLKEKDVIRAHGETRYFELCKDCNTKFEQIKQIYDEKYEKLRDKHKKQFEEYKNKLKEIGIDYD